MYTHTYYIFRCNPQIVRVWHWSCFDWQNLLRSRDETLPLGKDLTIAVLGSACQPKQDITQMLDKSRGRPWQMHRHCVFCRMFCHPTWPTFQDFSRCIDATWCNMMQHTPKSFESLHGRKPRWISAGCCFQQLWRAVFTEVGSGQLLHRWRFWQSDSQRSCAGVSMSQVPMASDGHIFWHFQGDGHVSACFSNMHRFLCTWDGLVDKNCCRSILEGIQDACKFANCKVHSDLSDDAEVFTSVHWNMFSQGFIQDMLH